MSECPVCGANISVADDVVKGELLECDDCGTELEVKNIDPLKKNWLLHLHGNAFGFFLLFTMQNKPNGHQNYEIIKHNNNIAMP